MNRVLIVTGANWFVGSRLYCLLMGCVPASNGLPLILLYIMRCRETPLNFSKNMEMPIRFMMNIVSLLRIWLNIRIKNLEGNKYARYQL